MDLPPLPLPPPLTMVTTMSNLKCCSAEHTVYKPCYIYLLIKKYYAVNLSSVFSLLNICFFRTETRNYSIMTMLE